MFKDRFDKLMRVFHAGAEGKSIDVKEVFQECLALFEELKNELKDASPEERQDMMRMLGDMYKQMLAETQKICKNSGMNEEQLMAFAENPSNFSPEQWTMIQDSRMKIHKAGQSLLNAMEKVRDSGKPAPEVHTHNVQPIRKEPGKKPKKSDWQRS